MPIFCKDRHLLRYYKETNANKRCTAFGELWMRLLRNLPKHIFAVTFFH